MTDAREVARSLSKAQREADILTPDAKYLLLTGEDRSLFGMAGVALILRGLMDYRRRYWLFGAAYLYPTRLGRKVRRILQEQGHGE